MSVQERVVRGTRWLDHVRPGWRDSLELGTLDLSNGGQCVLGQVFSEEAAAYAGRKVCGYSYVLTNVSHALRLAGLPGLAVGARLRG